MSDNLVDLLAENGVARGAPVQLMRHAGSQYPLVRYIGTHALTLYQSVQRWAFEPGTLIVGFYGHRPGHGLLLGVWRVEHVISTAEARRTGLLEGSFEDPDLMADHFHQLTQLNLLKDLVLKLEVKWGRELSWRRVLKAGDSYPFTVRDGCAVPFTGLDGVSLVMAELRIVLQDLSWIQALGSVAGVYLITDERSGRHYVGSASGDLGILQRWKTYAETGHGGNKQLVELLAGQPGRENDFRFTLLEKLALHTPPRKAVEREGFWKTALGSRTHGLNSN